MAFDLKIARLGVRPSAPRLPLNLPCSFLIMTGRTKATAEPTEPTRRSSRISAQPKAEVKEPVQKATAKSKKRTADVDGDSPAVKKVRVSGLAKVLETFCILHSRYEVLLYRCVLKTDQGDCLSVLLCRARPRRRLPRHLILRNPMRVCP